MKRISYELIDHGINTSQCLVPRSTYGTQYTHSVLGLGDTYNDALDEALDQISSIEGGIHQKEYERVMHENRIDDEYNTTTSAYQDIRTEISHSMSPYDYAEKECSHDPYDFCETCHNEVLEERVEKWFEENDLYYYVQIQYTIIETPLQSNLIEQLKHYTCSGGYLLYYYMNQ